MPTQGVEFNDDRKPVVFRTPVPVRMSLFSELKRRNVVRVAVAYIVASWLLLQVTDVLTSVLGLPESAGRLVFLLLVIGFIPALLFSWAYEITPGGIRRDTGTAPDAAVAALAARRLDMAVIAMLVVVAALVVVDRLVPEREPPPAVADPPVAEADAAEPPSVPRQRLPSLAVLPFANISADPDNEYFSDGISEELLNLLVNVQGLRVPSRTSSFSFKGLNTDIREIADQLQVDHILEGSVRKSGNRVRITAQLIDVSTDTHLWSETYDRELDDIFAIQDEIAAHIVGALKLALDFELNDHPPTSSLPAYNLFLQGRHLLRERGPGLRQAEQILLEAVALDPQFAVAWAALAQVYANLPNYLGDNRDQANADAVIAAQRALALQPGLADAGLVVALVAAREGRQAQALAQFAQIVVEHPRHSLARLWYGVQLFRTGYAKAALEQLSTAVELDPAYGLILDWHARALLVNGQREQARQGAVRAVQLGRTQGRVTLMHYCLGSDEMLSCMQSQLQEFPDMDWAFLERVPDLALDPSGLPVALAWADSQGDVDSESLQRSEYAKASFLLVAGDSVAFFEQLGRVGAFDDTYPTVLWSASAQRHRQSDEMQRWATETGLVDLWRNRGWPDLCRPAGTDGFTCD